MHHIYFVALTFLGTYVGRRLGWWLSRLSLYTAPWWFVIPCCIAWGTGVAYGVRSLCEWLQPNVILKIVFGWAQGLYVSIPNLIKQHLFCNLAV